MQERERANRAYWDRWSAEYQRIHGSEITARPDAWGAWRIPEAHLRVLPEVGGRAVLELGCGAGQWSVWLAGRGANVTGLDVSRVQLDHAQTAAKAAGVRVGFVQGSGESIPFATATFHVVLSDHGAMSWCDPDRTLPEVARVLRPGGLLAFCATSPFFQVCLEQSLDRPAERLQRDYFGLNAFDEGRGAASFNLPYGEWIRRFRECGLAVEALLEPRPSPSASSTFWPAATEWARRWPAEIIWKVRREG